MADGRKTILIIDDSDIEREIMKSIVSDEFQALEAENGYNALDIIQKNKDHLDAILLDVSMPVMDGFSVLRFMKERGLTDIPVFMVTAEATKDNVERATKFKICDFIKKPFDREDIQRRLKTKLGIMVSHDMSESDFHETERYIADLETVYDKYMKYANVDGAHYTRMVSIMRVLVGQYASESKDMALNENQIEIISKAAYFCDIGDMIVPSVPGFKAIKTDETGTDIHQEHTIQGANLIRLNYSPRCKFFVQICADMCLHHHERFDGTGYPNKVRGENNWMFTQFCTIADQFDRAFSKYKEHNELQFDFVMRDLWLDKGLVGKQTLALMEVCKSDIVACYAGK